MRRLIIILFLASICYGDVYTSHQLPVTDSTLNIGSNDLFWHFFYGNAFTDGTAYWESNQLYGFSEIDADSIVAHVDLYGETITGNDIFGTTIFGTTITDGTFVFTGGIITSGIWRGTAIDISDYTNLIAGTNITLAGNTLNVDDVFLRNDGDDTTTGTITAVEFLGNVTADTVIADTVTGGPSTFGDGGTTNYTEFNDDGAMILHGDARVMKHMHIGASSWSKGATAPTSTYENIFPTISFNTGQDDEAHYVALVPYEWDDTTDMEVHLRWQMPNNADNGNVFWKLKYIGVKEGEDPAGAGTEITQLSAGNHPQDEIIDTVFTTKILAANLARVDDLGLMLWRHGTDGSDDCGEDAELIAMHIHYTMNQLGQLLGTDIMIYEDSNVMIYEDGNIMLYE